MHLLVYGPGRLGSAILDAARAAGWTTTAIDHAAIAAARPGALADVVVDATRGDAVLATVEHALAAGNRRLVLATTGWDADATRVRERLLAAGAAAVVAPNLSLGAALFLRLTETAAAWYRAAGTFDPSIVEWHRAGKADRPSGTARALARRITAVDPRPHLEVVGVRSGSAPGTHLVTFDGPGESVELRLTARDRSAYADGALAAARWLVASPRDPGFHSFDAVVDDLLGPAPIAVPA